MSDEAEFELSVNDCLKIAEFYPDSYFTAAAQFAKAQEKTDIDIGFDGAIFATMTNTTEFVGMLDKLAIKPDDFTRVMLRALLEANRDNELMYFNLVSELIRLKMYKELYDYVPVKGALSIEAKNIFTEDVCKEILKVANFQESIVDLFSARFDLKLFHSLIEHKDIQLIWACRYNLPSIASQLVDTCSLDVLNDTDSGKDTALTWACYNKLPRLALKIIEKGFTNFGQVNSLNNTALIFACFNQLSDVVLAILAMNPSNIAQANNSGFTALLMATSNSLQDVAFAILASGEANVGQITNGGDTALIYACSKKLPELALAILATGQAKPSHISKNGSCAIAFASDLPEVKIAIELALAAKAAVAAP